MFSESPVIVTSPHSCDASVDPSCDALSGAVASKIAASTGGTGFFNDDVLRSSLDLNRPESRFHPWRIDVRKKVVDFVGKGIQPLLLDIHTYSKHDLGNDTTGWAMHDAVILVHPFNRDENDILNQLREDGKKNGINIGFALGKPCNRYSGIGDACNDIVSVTEFLGARSILVEFNQESLVEPGFLDKVGKVFNKNLIDMVGRKRKDERLIE